MINFNRRPEQTVGKEAQEVLDALDQQTQKEISYTEYFCKSDVLKKCFSAFSEMLLKNGNLAENLLDYMKQLQF